MTSLFSFEDGWMIYRITVGFGTLFIGLSALFLVYQLQKIVKLLEKLYNKLSVKE